MSGGHRPPLAAGVLPTASGESGRTRALGATVLEIRGLEISLPPEAEREKAVVGLDLDVHAGEIVCVVGESGSGKSLTGDAVMGLLPEGVHISGGSVRLDGEDLLVASASRIDELRARNMGMIFQNPMTTLNPCRTIGWQIDEVLRIHTTFTPAERRARVLDVLHRVDMPDPTATSGAHPHDLSAGQRQRAIFAMTLVLEPRLLIADEPTTALDTIAQRGMLELFGRIRRGREMAILFVTHDFGVVAEIADHVAVLHHGELVEQGSVRDVLDEPQHRQTRALIAAVPPLTPPAPRTRPSTSVVLEVTGLCKAFGRYGLLRGRAARSVEAVKNVSFVLRAGETLGLVGEEGSGKSTVARCVARLADADSGSVMLKRRDRREQHDVLTANSRLLHAMRRHLQLVCQDSAASLNPHRRVIDAIARGPRVHGASRSEARSIAFEMLELVELHHTLAGRFPHEISAGERQRVAIARAMALRPRILVADEPVSALDVSVQAEILALLSRLRERFQLSVLFVTHDLRVAAQFCDRIAVMERGEIVETGATGTLFTHPTHDYTRKLMASIPGREWVPPDLRGTWRR